ncbi:hypothetical protein [Rhodomicrobium lacus]|uniref:hypothetical protein n=1 Tax=Rhodomicrobium lacus TaxID=2498452 RepID=UPI000F8EFCE1|nr:hypothetical protein [Rhodomicrobium lacus]
MSGEQHGAHAEIFEVAGITYHVRRTFDLARRIEERCGPMGDVLRAIVADGVTVARLPVTQIAAVYEEALWGMCRRDVIEAHILAVGPMRAMQDVARLISNFFVGEERLAERLAVAEDGPSAPDPRPAASSIGAT